MSSIITIMIMIIMPVIVIVQHVLPWPGSWFRWDVGVREMKDRVT